MSLHDQIRAAVLADNELRDLAFEGRDAELASRILIDEPVGTITRREIVETLGLDRAAEVLSGLRGKGSRGITPNEKKAGELARLVDAGVDPKLFASQATLLPNEVTSLTTKKVNPPVDEVSAALLPWRPEGKAHQLVTE